MTSNLEQVSEMNGPRLAIICCLFALSTKVLAFQDDMTLIEGATVLKAGAITNVKCPPYGKYDCLNWPRDLYEFQGRNVCMRVNLGYGCGMSCEGFLASKNGQIALYTINKSPLNVGEKIEENSVELIQCPNRY